MRETGDSPRQRRKIMLAGSTPATRAGPLWTIDHHRRPSDVENGSTMTNNNTGTIPGEVRERVARGLQWIIANAETYHLDLNRVDLDTLDISSPSRCVLGQARGDQEWGRWPRSGYGATLDQAYPDDNDWRERLDFSREHGFDPSWGDSDVLREAWRQAILAHREGSA